MITIAFPTDISFSLAFPLQELKPEYVGIVPGLRLETSTGFAPVAYQPTRDGAAECEQGQPQ
jgi:hypothetical protein